jgi:hypothetical protein
MRHMIEKFLCLAGLLLIGTACSSEVHFVSSAPAPDGRWRADLYVEDGGGAAGFSSDEVRLLRSSEGSGPIVFEAASSDPVQIKWLDNTHLEIAYPRQDCVLKAKESVDGVRITYREDLSLRRHKIGPE